MEELEIRSLRDKISELSSLLNEARTLAIAHGIIVSRSSSEESSLKEKLSSLASSHETSEEELRSNMQENMAALRSKYSAMIESVEDETTVKKLIIVRKKKKIAEMKEEVTEGRPMQPLDSLMRE